MLHFKPLAFGKAEKSVIISFVVLVTFVIAISTIPVIAHWYNRITVAWTSWAIDYGYLGAFLAALIGNLTIVIVFPYTLVIFFLASSGLDPFVLGILTGVGAFLGELSGYVLGRWGSARFQRSRPDEYDALERIVSFRPKMVGWLLFLFSVTPMPDDVLFIPLGMLRYSFWKLTWPSVLGKIIAGWLITYTGSYLLRPLVTQPPTSWASILSQVGTLFSVALMMYTIFKVDWSETMRRLLPEEHRTAPLPGKEMQL